MSLPKNTEQEIGKMLANIGLSPSETGVLIALLQCNTAQKASTIAKKNKLNRTTLYGILKSLARKGLISAVDEHGVLRYQSIQPHLLVDYIERSKEKLGSDAKRLQQMLPLINAERTKGMRPRPSVQFFDGAEGLKRAYEDTIEHNKAKILYGFMGVDAAFPTLGPDYIYEYVQRRAKNGVRAFSIAMDSPETREFKRKDKQHLRVTKLLPPGLRFDTEIVFYDDKVVIASFAEDHPLAIMIEDKKIADTLKTLFAYMDSTLTE